MRSVFQMCLIMVLCALGSACVSPKPIKYYRIDLPATTAAAGEVSPITLAVGTIDCPPIMKDGRILYQVGTHEIGAYEYHRWVETPDRMVQNSLVRLLRASGKYSSVDVQRSNARTDYIVAGKIDEFAEIDNPEIHTRISMELELRDAKSGRIVWTRIYKREEPVHGKEVPDVVQSLDQNLKQGLSEIVAGLDQYFANDSKAR